MVESGWFSFDWVFEATWQACVIVLLVLSIERMFWRGAPGRLRYALWCLVLVRLLAPALPGSAMSLYGVFGVEGVGVEVAVRSTGGDAGAKVFEMNEGVGAGVGERLDGVGDASGALHWTIQGVAIGVWMVGAMGVLLWWVGAGYALGRRVKGMESVEDKELIGLLGRCCVEVGLKRAAQLVCSASIETPAVYGYWRPVVVIPKRLMGRLAMDEWRYVFLHELGHVKRADSWVNPWVMLAVALHWFNPMAWWAMGRLRAARELACDDWVLSATAPREHSDYGRALLRVIELVGERAGRRGLGEVLIGPTSLGLLGMGRSGDLMRRRIELIAKHRRRGVGQTLMGVMLLGAVGCCSLTEPGGEGGIVVDEGGRVNGVSITTEDGEAADRALGMADPFGDVELEAVLGEEAARVVRVEARFVWIGAEFYGDEVEPMLEVGEEGEDVVLRGGALDRVARLIYKSGAGKMLAAPSITLHNGKSASVIVSNQMSYIKSVKIVAGGEYGGYDPEIGSVKDGVWMAVLPVLEAEGGGMRLHVRAEVQQMKGFEEVRINHGENNAIIEVPQVESYVFESDGAELKVGEVLALVYPEVVAGEAPFGHDAVDGEIGVEKAASRLLILLEAKEVLDGAE